MDVVNARQWLLLEVLACEKGSEEIKVGMVCSLAVRQHVAGRWATLVPYM